MLKLKSKSRAVGAAAPGARIDWPTPSDWRAMMQIPLLTAVAWLLPPALWHKLSRGRGAADKAIDIDTRVAAHLEGLASQQNKGLAGDDYDLDRAELLPYLRSYRLGGWNPEIALEGADALRDLQEVGQGAVLWVAAFDYASLVAKKALWEAGIGVHHLSRPDHGLSSSRFGRRFLNWIMQRAETMVLAERVVLEDGNERAGLRRLRRVLDDGGLVTIAGGSNGRQVRSVPICDGQYDLATGAPALALSAKAPLFAVFVHPTDDDLQHFRVVVEGPLDPGAAKSRDDAIDALMTDFVARHGPYFRAHARRWNGIGCVRQTADA